MTEFNLICLMVVAMGTILCFVNGAVNKKTYMVKFINDKVRSPEIAVMRIVKARNENEAVKKAIRKIDKRDRSRYRLYEVTEVMR